MHGWVDFGPGESASHPWGDFLSQPAAAGTNVPVPCPQQRGRRRAIPTSLSLLALTDNLPTELVLASVVSGGGAVALTLANAQAYAAASPSPKLCRQRDSDAPTGCPMPSNLGHIAGNMATRQFVVRTDER